MAGQAPSASELEYSVRQNTTDLYCESMKQKVLGWKHGVGTDIQESKKGSTQKGRLAGLCAHTKQP